MGRRQPIERIVPTDTGADLIVASTAAGMNVGVETAQRNMTVAVTVEQLTAHRDHINEILAVHASGV